MPDRFTGEPPEQIYGPCVQCDNDVYYGDTIYDIEGEIVHEECLIDYLRAKDVVVKKVAEVA